MTVRPAHAAARYRRRAGTVLIVAMIVTFALAGIVLVLCRSMRVEAAASANLAAAAQASAVVRGAEQYVLALIEQEGEEVRDFPEQNFAAVRIGDGIFWIVRPVYEEDEQLPLFGLVDESSKININKEDFSQLERLPGMTYVAASSIMDWIDGDNNVERDGAEMETYLNGRGGAEPYYAKNARLETVEELLMINGIDRVMLYGDGTMTTPLGQRSSVRAAAVGGGAMVDRQLARGIFDLVTVYSRENNTSADGQQRIRIGDSGRAINQDGSHNSQNMRNRLRDRLRGAGLSEARVTSIISAIGTTDMNDLFEFYRRAKSGAQMTEQEFDQVHDLVTTSGSRSLRGLVNINTAPPAVLRCLSGLQEDDVEKLLARRRTIDTTAQGSNGIAWVAEALTPERAAEAKLGAQITTRSSQWSADILAASGNGRAFKRVRIVVDARQGTPQIIYRRDLTHRGWPMDRTILASLRAGELSSQPSPFSIASTGQQPGGRF